MLLAARPRLLFACVPFSILLAACTRPGPRAAANSASLRDRTGVEVVIEKDLEGGAHPLGRSPNPLSPRGYFEVKAARIDASAWITYTLIISHQTAGSMVTISLDGAQRTASAKVGWGTDVRGNTEHRVVYGGVLIDHWPKDEKDPVCLHYLLCWRDGDRVRTWSDSFDTHPLPESAKPTPR